MYIYDVCVDYSRVKNSSEKDVNEDLMNRSVFSTKRCVYVFLCLFVYVYLLA